MNCLGAAVVGLGVGRQHVIGFDKSLHTHPIAVCDLADEKLAEAKREFPNVDCLNRWESLIERDDIDLLSIASFDDMHADQVCRSLAAGKHVFVEKPLCLNRPQWRRIRDQWRRSRCWLASNLVLRSAPIYGWLKEQIELGRLGQIYAIDGEYLYGRIHKLLDGWRGEIDGYSVMLGGGIHMADLMFWMLNEEPLRVRAHGNRLCTQGTAFRNLDFVSAAYEFPSGAIGRLAANFGCVHRHQHVLRVYGTEATFLLDDQGPRLVSTRDPRQSPQPIDLATLPEHKWDLIPPLAESIVGRQDPGPLGRRELNLISACLAADEAVAADAEIEIEYL